MTQAAHDKSDRLLYFLLIVLIVSMWTIAIGGDVLRRWDMAAEHAEYEHRELTHSLSAETQRADHALQEVAGLHAELSAAHAALFGGQHHIQPSFGTPVPWPPLAPPPIDGMEFESDGHGGWIKKGFTRPPKEST